jgi:hypothetical protein
MNIVAAAKALNQRAVRENWHHFCDPTLAFSDPSYLQLLEIWRTRAGDRAMPRRSEMTPRDLKNILRHLLVLERVRRNPSGYRWKLIGTGLTDMAGDNTGKMIEDTVPPEHLPRWHDCADLILEGGQPLRFRGQVHLKGREYLEAENLYVPLANDNDEPTYIMGLCRYTPRRFGEGESWENELASIPGGLL